jgi:hypothetical protein
VESEATTAITFDYLDDEDGRINGEVRITLTADEHGRGQLTADG